MRIATWNVNSIRARLPTVLAVLEAIAADVVCLQELKCETAAFPELELRGLGYNTLVHGQKTYNGVAILSRFPLEETARSLPGEGEDAQARYLETLISAPRPVRVASIYVPNGNPAPGEKYDLKRAFMDRLHDHARSLLAFEEPVILAGDYNCIPQDTDCWDPQVWEHDALALPETRAAFRRLLHLGYTEAFATHDGRSQQYTFWDYQAGAFPKDHGIRIDHHLLSAQAADRLQAVEIHRKARARDKPSDHVPVIITLAD
jgi:exodeoxyribonuclease-3